MRTLGTICLSLVAVVAGCQRYRPAPLDLPGHRAAWEGRDPAAGEVAAFAERLGRTANEPDASFDVKDGLTVREAEVVALFFNPQLRAARLKARVPQVGAAQAGRWADPQLNVDVQRIIEGVENPWVLGGMLGFTIPVSGRLGAERKHAGAQADAATLGVLVEESRVLAELNSGWLSLAIIDRRLELTREFLADLDRIVASAERLRARGEIDPVEAKLFRIEQVRRRAEARGLELRRRESEVAVKAVMGLVPEAGIGLVPSMPEVREGPDAAGRRRWVEANHPRLRQARAEYAVAERSLELEVRRQYPDVGLGGGFGTEEGDRRLLGGLSVPVPMFNANRRAIAEARATRDAARGAAEATYEELVGSLARGEIALESARDRREFIEQELGPLVDEQLRDARNLGRLGAASTVVLLEALTRAYETKVELLEAVEREAAAVNQLNELLRAGAGIAPDADPRAQAPGIEKTR